MNDENFKNLPTKFDFHLIIEIFENAQLFYFVLQCTQREHVHNVRWARSPPKAMYQKM